MATTILTDADDGGPYCYGAYVLRKGPLIDENDLEIVDEAGNNILGYGIVAKED